jgi:hypothetical protein
MKQQKQKQLAGVLCAGIFSLGMTGAANAALIGRLPATPGGSDWQAYYDDQLDITWAANANINGALNWSNQVAWAAGLNLGGVTGWRLPSMDVNGDGVVVDCSTTSQAACMDNEFGHLYYYGAGTVFGSGITASSPGPFSNVQSSSAYWSGTEIPLSYPSSSWRFHFGTGYQGAGPKNLNHFAWAVHSGNVGAVPVSAAVPVPAVVWLFGSGLIGLLGVAKRKR